MKTLIVSNIILSIALIIAIDYSYQLSSEIKGWQVMIDYSTHEADRLEAQCFTHNRN